MQPSRNSPTRLCGAAMIASIAFALATPVFAGTSETHERAALEFRAYCASCHGVDGDGNGPVAATLKVAPPDLTRLAFRNGGVFPDDATYKTISGLGMPASHGTTEMPVWGLWFSSQEIAESLHTGDETPPLERADNRIRALIAYLKSIQK